MKRQLEYLETVEDKRRARKVLHRMNVGDQSSPCGQVCHKGHGQYTLGIYVKVG